MIGLDTNVVVRYIAQDDPVQSKLATDFIEETCSSSTPGYISLVVLVELIWVSESCYQASRAEVAHIVRQILRARQLVVQKTELVWKALRHFEGSTADFADSLVQQLALAAGCSSVVSFDKAAAKAGMDLLK